MEFALSYHNWVRAEGVQFRVEGHNMDMYICIRISSSYV